MEDDQSETQSSDVQYLMLTHSEDKMAVMVNEYDSEALHTFNLPQGHDYLPTPVPKKVVIKKSENAPEPSTVMKYNCLNCPYITTCKRLLNKHKKLHLKPQLITTRHNVKCPSCSFTTTKLQYLKVHSKLHYKEKPYKCLYCSVCTRSLLELAHHYKSHGVGKKKMARPKAPG